eukprot:TRINITY_DN1462_c0_g2_i2.p1 TRINITY_DN1462_c0_g2~~TRINITY_DN1462_c0_g2_i2.p1  ORF type:complete len:436 (-),score=81.86 TRINITY_DN1462_c0_g2_i2:29-1273(-)
MPGSRWGRATATAAAGGEGTGPTAADKASQAAEAILEGDGKFDQATAQENSNSGSGQASASDSSRWRRGPSGSEKAAPAAVPAKAAATEGGGGGGGAAQLTPTSTVALRSGLCLPVLGLGTRQLKAGGECRDAVRAALRCGYRLVDTAAVYGNEEDVCQGIRAAGMKREDVFIVSKLAPADHGEAEDVEEALKASLLRLGTTYVDLYLMQSPKGGSVIWTWDAMLEMRCKGLARAVGVCNFGVAHLKNLVATGREAPEVLQVELHFGNQQRALAAHCRSEGIAVMAACPLARGQLFRSQTALGALAAKRGRTEAEFALRWCLQRGYIAIPKSKTAPRIEANAPFGFALGTTEMEALGEVSDVSDGDAGLEAPRRRRRRPRRRAKGKGKGKAGGQSKSAGGNAAQRAANTLFGLS